MKNFISYLLGISIALLLLILFEGLFTGGEAFKFQNYSLIGWITQILLIIVFTSIAIKIVEEASN